MTQARGQNTADSPSGWLDVHAHLAPTLSHEFGCFPVPSALFSPQDLDVYLRLEGASGAFVSIPPPFYRQDITDRTERAAWARAVNHGILEATAEFPSLRPLLYLPFEDPQVAASEYAFWRTTDAYIGVTAAAGGKSDSLASEQMTAIWKTLDEDSQVVILHPGMSPDPRLQKYYLHNLIGNPLETTIAAAELIFGNVLTRNPSVSVVLSHAGGALPAVVGRWQHAVECDRPGIGTLDEEPRIAVRRLYTDCLSHDRDAFPALARTFGACHLLLGSDWPFPMGLSKPVDELPEDDEVRTLVGVTNPRVLLGARLPQVWAP